MQYQTVGLPCGVAPLTARPFGDFLEGERAKRGLTLTEFARDVLGIDHGMASRYVNGLATPGRKTLRKIAAALNGSVAELDALIEEQEAARRGRHRPGLGAPGEESTTVPVELVQEIAERAAAQAVERVLDLRDPSLPLALYDVGDELTEEEEDSIRRAIEGARERRRQRGG